MRLSQIAFFLFFICFNSWGHLKTVPQETKTCILLPSNSSLCKELTQRLRQEMNDLLSDKSEKNMDLLLGLPYIKASSSTQSLSDTSTKSSE